MSMIPGIRFIGGALLALALLVGFVSHAKAETIAATYEAAHTVPAEPSEPKCGGTDCISWCAGWAAYKMSNYTCGSTYAVSDIAGGKKRCTLWYGPTAPVPNGLCWTEDITPTPTYSCPVGTLSGSNCNIPAGYSCPTGQGWTLSGQSCSRPDCPYPQSYGSGSSCSNPDCPSGGTAAGSFGGEGQGPSAINKNGCAINCQTVATMGGAWGAAGCKYTGQPAQSGAGGDTNATPEPAPTTPQGCLSGGQGYVSNSSGVVSCISASDAPASQPITVTDNSSSSSTGPGGSTSSNTQTSQTCAGGNCSVSQTNTTTGGSNPGTTTTDYSNKGAFCEQNPNSPICKAGDGKTDCDKYPNASGCKELGTPTEEGALSSQQIGVSSITPVVLATNMNCPAPIQLPKNLGQFEWTPICDVAGMIRPLVLLFAWVGAGLIVIGAARNG